MNDQDRAGANLVVALSTRFPCLVTVTAYSAQAGDHKGRPYDTPRDHYSNRTFFVKS